MGVCDCMHAMSDKHAFHATRAATPRVRVAVAVALAIVAAACGAPPAPPLEPEDFTLSGVPLDADTTEIRLSFGAPDSMTAAENPFDAEQPFAIWHYRDFEARFSGERAVGYLVEGTAEATLRGVRVGTMLEEVARRYGTPTVEQPSRWTYVDDDPDLGFRVVDFVVQDEVVTRFYIGEAVR